MTKKNKSKNVSSTLPLFYKSVVPLNKEKHNTLYLDQVEGFTHTKDTNSVYIAAVEFVRAAHEYPIVFAKVSDGNVFPVVLLGLERNKNSFLDDDGNWKANYIPAYVRRYPFIFAAAGEKSENFAVCVDEAFSGLNTDKKGQPLFDQDGKESDFLERTIAFLRDYQRHIQITNAFCQNLEKLDILEAMQVNIKSINSKEERVLGGFMGINRTKLKALDSEELMKLIQEDHLELIYAHLSSLANLQQQLGKRISS